MINTLSAGPDSRRSRLRATLAALELEIRAEIARRPRPVTDQGTSQSKLLTSFADLVEQLALGPEPEVRPCPVCQNVVMRTATLCGHCWTRLTPPPDGGVE